MSKPKTEIENKEYFKDIYFLYEGLNTIKNIEELKLFIKDLLTRSELRMLKRRWHIANLLSQGLDIRTVAQKSKTSTQTVSKMKAILEGGRGGLKIVLERINERENSNKVKRTKFGSKFVKGWFK